MHGETLKIETIIRYILINVKIIKNSKTWVHFYFYLREVVANPVAKSLDSYAGGGEEDLEALFEKVLVLVGLVLKK